MLLSTIIHDFDSSLRAEFYNEKEFDAFALTASEIDEVSCVFLENPKFIEEIKRNVSMIITTEALADVVKTSGYGVCVVDSPRVIFFKLHNFMSTKATYLQPEFDTVIGENCKISKLASISSKNVIIGKDTIIDDFVVIKENTSIGDNCIIGAGTVIGGSGFEFKTSGDEIFRVAHVGSVVIENNVEIQYNSCIDKAIYPWDDTIIGEFTKIDNLVHIAHGVKIGRANMIVANSGIGGRVKTGNQCWIGFGTTIRNGLTIGNNARINMGSVVTQSVDTGRSVTGNFAIDHDLFISNIKHSTEKQ